MRDITTVQPIWVLVLAWFVLAVPQLRAATFEAVRHVPAADHWYSTGLQLKAGASYALVSSGTWSDGGIPSGSDGYPSRNVLQRLAEWLRRMPSSNWFALIGGLDRQKETQFAIGTGCIYRPQYDGELTCFANDVWGFYWNNRGSVDLVVKQIEIANKAGLRTCR